MLNVLMDNTHIQELFVKILSSQIKIMYWSGFHQGLCVSVTICRLLNKTDGSPVERAISGLI